MDEDEVKRLVMKNLRFELGFASMYTYERELKLLWGDEYIDSVTLPSEES